MKETFCWGKPWWEIPEDEEEKFTNVTPRDNKKECVNTLFNTIPK